MKKNKKNIVFYLAGSSDLLTNRFVLSRQGYQIIVGVLLVIVLYVLSLKPIRSALKLIFTTTTQKEDVDEENPNNEEEQQENIDERRPSIVEQIWDF
ncbi:unnamed protein product, partial [Rotaria magnacalcarata]